MCENGADPVKPCSDSCLGACVILLELTIFYLQVWTCDTRSSQVTNWSVGTGAGGGSQDLRRLIVDNKIAVLQFRLFPLLLKESGFCSNALFGKSGFSNRVVQNECRPSI